MKSMEAFIFSEGNLKVIFAIEDGSILDALISLIASYYVFFLLVILNQHQPQAFSCLYRKYLWM